MKRTEPVKPVPVLARIEYEDEGGHHSCDIVKDSVTIGRGGNRLPRGHPYSVLTRRLARARPNPPGPADRQLLRDRPQLARHHAERPSRAKGYDEVDGTKRENGAETPLPDSARIGLADTVFLEFGVGPLMAVLLWARLLFLRYSGAVLGLHAGRHSGPMRAGAMSGRWKRSACCESLAIPTRGCNVRSTRTASMSNCTRPGHGDRRRRRAGG